VWTFYPEDNNFVLDIDKFKHAGSVAEMVQYIKDKGMPLPHKIVQTSPRSFHLAYKITNTVLDRDDIRPFAFSLVGAPSDAVQRLGEAGFKAEYGLDLSYLSQNHKNHKIRVEGSVNTKNGFVCKAWTNPDYVLFDVKTSVKPETVVKKESKRIVSKYYVRLYSDFLKDTFSKAMTIKVSRFFAGNSGHLAKGNLAISQMALAKELGIVQTSVSRLVKKLVRIGFLSVTNGNYNFNPVLGKVVCKEYGLGEALAAYISDAKADKAPTVKSYVEKISEELLEDYEPGARNEMQMRDVRHLRYLNIAVEDKVEFLKEKNRDYVNNYGKSSLTENDIRGVIDNFDRKAVDLPVIDFAIAIRGDIRVEYKKLRLKPFGMV